MLIIRASHVKFVLIMLVMWFYMGNANAATPPLLIELEKMDWQIYLPDSTEKIENQLKKLSVQGDLTNWKQRAVLGLVKDVAYWSLEGRLWYRVQFDAGDVAQKLALGLLLGHVLEANSVWLNEHLLGKNGKVDSDGSHIISDVHSLRYYTIPSGLLRSKSNTLIVEVQALSTWAGIASGPIGIAHSGPAWRYKANAEKPMLFAQSGLLALMLISLVVGLLTLFALRRFDAEHLAFVSLFFFALIAFGFDSLVFYQSGLKTQIIQRISYVFSFAIAISLIIYTRALISLRPSKFSSALITLITLACVGFYFVSSILLYWLILSCLFLLIVVAIVYLFIIGLPEVHEGNLAVGSVLIGIISLGLSVGYYSIADPVGSWFRTDELGVGLLMLSLLVGYVLRLMSMQNQLRQMSLKLVNISEQERKHLARELHDGINQRLATTRLRLQMHESRINDLKLEPISGELLIAMEEMDRLVQGLQPFNLERHSLVQAMQLEARGLNTVSGINIDVIGEDVELPGKFSQHLYRIFQESVQNAVKHANADHIFIELYKKRNRLTLSIRDDGNGFDKISSQNNRVGIGMISLRERVALIGGSLHIESQKGQGTLIFVQADIE